MSQQTLPSAVYGEKGRICDTCRRCVRACPADIDIPSLLIVEEGSHAVETKHTASQDGQPIDCIECGICSMRCPQGFPLLQIVRKYAMKQASESIFIHSLEENQI